VGPAHAFDRRRFLQLLGALGALPAGSALLTACGDDGAETTGAVTGAGTTAGAPVKGGVLRAAMGSDIRGFDVQRFYDPQSVTLGDLVFSRLVALDPADPTKLVPDLAESVPTPSDDGRTWEFTLRQNATFHDGTPVTAADVKYSIERLIDANTKSEGGSYYTGWIEGTEALAAGDGGEASGIVAVDDRTVRIELTEPRAAFLPLMAIWFGSIYPKAYAQDVGADGFNRRPIGSGPFSVEDYQPGKTITFARHDGYHAADEIHLDGIELSLAVAPDTAILQVDGGQIDVLTDEVPPASYQAIRDDPQRAARLVEDLVDNCIYLTLNDVDASPVFKSVEARTALHQAIDKRRIVQQMQGRGEVASGFWSPRSAYFDEEFPDVAYDVEAATSALAAAGVAGQEVEIIVPAPGSFFPTDQWGPSLVQDLEAVGLQPKLTSLEFSAWLGRTMDPGAIVPNGWSMDVPHGSFVVDSAFTTATEKAADESGACCNFSRWASAEVDELNRVGVATTDKQEEIDAYKEIMRIVIGEQRLWIPVVWPKRSFYRGEKVGGLTVNPNTAAMLLSRLWVSA
jgi:ABC-type transport system substrate-binding protein